MAREPGIIDRSAGELGVRIADVVAVTPDDGEALPALSHPGMAGDRYRGPASIR